MPIGFPIFANPSSSLAVSGGTGPAIEWSLIVLLIAFVALIWVMRVRRWFKEDDPGPDVGFTLSDLRQLHREGKMTDEEFERARSKMVEAGKALAESLPDPLAGRKPQVPRNDHDRLPPTPPA